MNLHLCTPLLQVIDPRALLVREVAFCRSAEDGVAEQRVTRHLWDEAGRSVADWDPRLWENGLPANTTVVRSLSSQVLLNESVDAGWKVRLAGADGQRVDSWDGRGSYSATEYDDQLRPACVTESLVEQPLRVVERFIYGDASEASASHNVCGQPIRHDDPAGTLGIADYGLTGTALVQNRRFLDDVQSVDWPLDVTQRDSLLEPGEGYSTHWEFDATSASISQTDAVGNRSLYCYGIDGLLNETRLKSAQSASARSLIRDIHYSAEGQMLIEYLGNGVVTENTYESETSRLIRIYASKANGSVLQDLNYQYDPVGNVVAIEDRAQPTRYSANQRIDPVNRYQYDSLYQLIEATGREVSAGTVQSPALPEMQNLPLDTSQMSNYTQTFNYDAGSNLLQLRHVGAQSFTRNMRVAPNSNRSLSEDDTDGNVEEGFDANGNLQQLVRGQSLNWDPRNQLIRVTAVEHEDGSEDDEVYVYDRGGQRCRKIRTAQAKARSLNAEVRYLPGLEIRSEPNGEVLHVARVQAARTGVRLLHWQEGKPDGIDNDQLRYSLNDHLGSCSLEIDDEGALISQEGYYPFGATAWWAARSAVEAKYKTVRYSGKERDATGLYYYGFRYYAPWLMRWVNPDPARHLTGLNAFRAMNGSPVTWYDPDGLMDENTQKTTKPSPLLPSKDNTYERLAEQGTISQVQAKGMAPVRQYWGELDTPSPSSAAYRDAIPNAIVDLSKKGRGGFLLTSDAHILAAVRTGTSRPSGSVMYHGGEILSAGLNATIGEQYTSKVMGPLSDIFNGPDRPQAELDRNRQAVSSTFKAVGKMAMRSSNPGLKLVGGMSVATGNALTQSEAATVAGYSSLKRSTRTHDFKSRSSGSFSQFNFPPSDFSSHLAGFPATASDSAAEVKFYLPQDEADEEDQGPKIFGLSHQELLAIATKPTNAQGTATTQSLHGRQSGLTRKPKRGN